MRVKDYKCKCGHDDFFFADKGNQKGIYCSYCGKWLKWADKDEQNLTLKQEPTVINEIPKDYKYDTETKDFLVYRHKYTGDEIHIEKYKDGNRYVCFGQHHGVVAWMPLPEPYREESEVTE